MNIPHCSAELDKPVQNQRLLKLLPQVPPLCDLCIKVSSLCMWHPSWGYVWCREQKEGGEGEWEDEVGKVEVEVVEDEEEEDEDEV